MCISIGHLSIGHLSALCQEIVSPLSNWESDTLGNTQIRRPLWERTAFSRSNWPYPSDIPADGSANGSSPREKFLGTSENTRWKLRWVEEVGPQPESRAIANAKWLRDNFCLSSLSLHHKTVLTGKIAFVCQKWKLGNNCGMKFRQRLNFPPNISPTCPLQIHAQSPSFMHSSGLDLIGNY